jgi:Spy/CpxP family protein refolding chaperone
MKLRKLTIVLFAAAQMSAANFVSAQTASATPVPPLAPPGPPFGKPNLSDLLARMLWLTDAQRAQVQPYIDAVQPQLDATHQQARQAADALLKQLDASIRPLLTPEQQTKLDAFEAIRAVGLPPPSPTVELIFGKGFERGSQ